MAGLKRQLAELETNTAQRSQYATEAIAAMQTEAEALQIRSDQLRDDIAKAKGNVK